MLYKKQLKNASIENATKYRKYKNILNSCLKQAEENFYQSIFLEKQKGFTNIWKTFGETLNSKKRNTNHKLQILVINNKVVTDEKRYCERIEQLLLFNRTNIKLQNSFDDKAFWIIFKK